VKKRTSDATTTTSIAPRRRRGKIVRYLIVAVGCVLIIDALVGDRGFLAMLKARQQYRTLETSLVRSREENAQLREQARQLREDPLAVEDIARRELGLIRPGEKLFIIKDVK
jgi:cell division protein FtsB